MSISLKKAPFNIRLLPNSRSFIANLDPVTSVDIHNSAGALAENGLYSPTIFGRIGDKKRNTTLAYIDLGLKIFHPIIYANIERLNGFYKDIYEGKAYSTYDKTKSKFVESDQVSGKTGSYFFLSHYQDLKFERNTSVQRGLKIDVIEEYKRTGLYDFVLTLPAGLRDLEEGRYGNLTSDVINDAYRSLIGLSKVVDRAYLESTFNDNTRAQMQRQFNIIYNLIYEFIEGKSGFTRSNYIKRKVRDGTRTVMTQMVQSVEDLEGPQAKSINETVVGLHQIMRAALPYTQLAFQHRLITDIFNTDGTGNLISPKTFKPIVKPIPAKFKDRFTTEDGILGLLHEFGIPEIKDTEVLIAGLPIALIYRTDHEFYITTDINTIPPELRSNVRPIVKSELYYYLTKPKLQRTRGWVTRYPFATENSTYPTIPYIKTTSTGISMTELESVEVDGVVTLQPIPDQDPTLYNEFPILGQSYVDTIAVAPCRMNGLGSDNDGDTASYEAVLTDEAIDEVDEYLTNSSMLMSQGKFRHVLSTDIVEWGCSHYTTP